MSLENFRHTEVHRRHGKNKLRCLGCSWSEGSGGMRFKRGLLRRKNKQINFFQDIDIYMLLRCSYQTLSNRFFLGVTNVSTMTYKVFKCQPMDRNTFMTLLKLTYFNEGVAGERYNCLVTKHDLRGTLSIIPFWNGHSEFSVAMRTGHSDPKIVKSYQYLRGSILIQQQQVFVPSLLSKVRANTLSD